jgi:hypothetical protein
MVRPWHRAYAHPELGRVCLGNHTVTLFSPPPPRAQKKRRRPTRSTYRPLCQESTRAPVPRDSAKRREPSRVSEQSSVWFFIGPTDLLYPLRLQSRVFSGEEGHPLP